MSRTFGRPFQLVFFSTLVLGVGCGPFGYLKKVAKEANQAVADAEAVGAEEYAPYEYWGAVTYLEQSKVMMAYSEYERSFDYGDRAKDLAAEAKKKTEMREAGKNVVTEAETPVGTEPGAAEEGDEQPQPDPSNSNPEPGGATNAQGSSTGEGSVGGSVGVGGKAQGNAGGDQ